MQDVGKLVIPLNILEKPSRLSDKLDDVRYRAQISIMSERVTIAACTGVSDDLLDSEEDGDGLLDMISDSTEWINLEESARKLAKSEKLSEMAAEAQNRITELENALRFVEDVNERGYIDDATKKRIEEIAEIKCRTYNGEFVNFLDDYDVEALTVQKGNLTEAERKVVMSHVSETYEILKAMNFEGPFAKVPDWAGGHHEYLDGSGYPNGLKGDEIGWETRLLTIIDIYDALTAEDRPYKPPIPSERAFEILRGMAEEGKIDGEILEDFYNSGAWKR
jgi:HD-GYP domain-containing protein (c-di-GMP phosphodiesterase class II)